MTGPFLSILEAAQSLTLGETERNLERWHHREGKDHDNDLFRQRIETLRKTYLMGLYTDFREHVQQLNSGMYFNLLQCVLQSAIFLLYPTC